jgi:N-carbamoylputrescine amidase
VVQMAAVNRATTANLRRAAQWAEMAAHSGATLVLFPELMPGGYSLYFDIWDSAERSNGPTTQWMRSTSKRLGVWLGTSFLEADGEDFYNTFVLTGPDGAEAGRVRKQVPADAEAFFFRGAAGSHVLETAIGRIGVSICAEGYYCVVAEQMRRLSADLVLMPHSAPDSSRSGGLPAAPGTHLGLWYARKLGVPVAFVNKVGPWRTRSLAPPPPEVVGFFPGLSVIIDSDAKVLTAMDGSEGMGLAEVMLDPRRKTTAKPVCSGVGIAELSIGGPAGVAAVMQAQAAGRRYYDSSDLRRRKALSISGAHAS